MRYASAPGKDRIDVLAHLCWRMTAAREGGGIAAVLAVAAQLGVFFVITPYEGGHAVLSWRGVLVVLIVLRGANILGNK